MIAFCKSMSQWNWLGIISTATFMVLVGDFVCRDIQRHREFDLLRAQNEQIIQKVAIPNYPDMEFPKIPAGATKSEVMLALGTYHQIAVDAVKRREDRIHQLEAKIKE